MKCPHCSAPVSVFDAPLHRFAADRKCPQCGGAIRMGSSIGTLLIGIALSFALLWVLSVMEAPPFWRSMATTMAIVVVLMSAMRLGKGAE